MDCNPHNLTNYTTHEETEVKKINDFKKKKTLGLRLGHLKHHEHIKQAEEALEQLSVKDDRLM